MVLTLPNGAALQMNHQSNLKIRYKIKFLKKKKLRLTPNYLTKSKNARETYVGSELDECKDFSGLFYQLPFHKVIVGMNIILSDNYFQVGYIS